MEIFECVGDREFSGSSRKVAFLVANDFDVNSKHVLHVHLGKVATLQGLRSSLPAQVVALAVESSDDGAFVDWNGVGTAYGRFLINEILPLAETNLRERIEGYRIPEEARYVGISGSENAGVAAICVGWHFPQRFGKVLVGDAAFDRISGANEIPAWIRWTEPKPIGFLFHEAGEKGLHSPVRLSAKRLFRTSLQSAGYSVELVHVDQKAFLKEGLDWQVRQLEEVPSASSGIRNELLRELLIPGEDWERLGGGYRFSEGTTVDRNGVVYFNDIQASKAYVVELDGSVQLWLEDTERSLGQATLNDGLSRVAVSSRVEKIFHYDPDRKQSIYYQGTTGNDVICDSRGNLYLSNPTAQSPFQRRLSKLKLIRPSGESVVLDEGMRFPNGLALSPDERILYVNDWGSHWVYRFDVKEDATLGPRRVFARLERLEDFDGAGSDGMRVDSEGRVWVTTEMGIQIFSTEGELQAILRPPEGKITHFVFGGENYDTLYATNKEGIYRRRLNVRGVNCWEKEQKE